MCLWNENGTAVFALVKNQLHNYRSLNEGLPQLQLKRAKIEDENNRYQRRCQSMSMRVEKMALEKIKLLTCISLFHSSLYPSLLPSVSSSFTHPTAGATPP